MEKENVDLDSLGRPIHRGGRKNNGKHHGMTEEERLRFKAKNDLMKLDFGEGSSHSNVNHSGWCAKTKGTDRL